MVIYYKGNDEGMYCEILDLKYRECYDEELKKDLVITIKIMEVKKSYSLKLAYGKIIFSNHEMLNNDYDILYNKLITIIAFFNKKREVEQIERLKRQEEEIIKTNKEELYDKLVNFYGFDGFTHETTINNLIKILNTRKLKCRNLVTNFDDVANPEVLEHTLIQVKKYVRLYFGYMTPTNYNFDLKNGDKMCYIVFNWNIVNLPHSYFSDGNAASKNTTFFNIREYFLKGADLMEWKSIFERGYLPNKYPLIPLPFSESYEEKKRKRCAEILIKESIDVKYIDKIIFKNEDVKRDFISILNNENILSELNEKIIVDDSVFFEFGGTYDKVFE